MTHPQILEVVARLHVDPAFRRQFLEDPAAALAPLGLPDAARDALARIDPRSVAILGKMASYHRCARIQEHLPWVDERLRPDLGSVLARHLARAEPALLNRDEAIAFCDHLEQETPLDPPYIAELARYERLRISVAWGLDGGGAAPRVATFAFPIPRVLDALGEPGWPLVERSPVRLVFKKVPGIPAIIIVG